MIKCEKCGENAELTVKVRREGIRFLCGQCFVVEYVDVTCTDLDEDAESVMRLPTWISQKNKNGD